MAKSNIIEQAQSQAMLWLSRKSDGESNTKEKRSSDMDFSLADMGFRNRGHSMGDICCRFFFLADVFLSDCMVKPPTNNNKHKIS